jgi:NADH-quinone oxidoreductase subunit L
MKGLVPLFNRFSRWLADKVDWAFWHDFVHDRIIRDMFVGFAEFSASVLDARGVDGIVNGTARVTDRLAGALRVVQTGFVRNYALAIFLGVVALIAYFVLMSG